MSDVCDDDRFEVIAEAKKDLLESTNIEMNADEMAVLDNFLFRCWQMGWLRQYETFEFCTDCKEYDNEKHCCHRWTKFIRRTIDEMKANERTAKVVHKQQTHIVLPPKSTTIEYETVTNLWNECGNCGAMGMYHGWNYCPKCGAKLDWSE